jgi:2-keto-4-pentenoate hydratase
MIEDFCRVLQERIRKEISVLSEDVASGVCSSFEAYRYTSGVIYGLKLAERNLLELREAARINDED